MSRRGALLNVDQLLERVPTYRHNPLFNPRVIAPIRRTGPAMLLMIDNYDSFTFNLVQYLGELGQEVKVVRNDALDVAGIRALHPARIMISPGPGTPDDSGVSLDVLRELSGEIPIFGVCLGHQALGQVFGGKVVRARQIMHGKTSPVHHRGQGVFAGLPNPFDATRYHSLVVDKASVPDCLEVTAWTQHADGSVDEIMGLRHRTLAVEGVQFHPESILTEHGYNLLRNFLGLPLQLAA
jgi:anthranilate synthase component 2